MRLQRLMRLFAQERPRLILWSPVALMAGIAFYFNLDEEPPLYAGAAVLASSLLLLFNLRRMRLLLLLMVWVALGFTAAQLRNLRVATPLLAGELHFRQIEGTL